MKLLSSLVLVGLLTGCCCWNQHKPLYHRVTTADFEGKPITEWISEGKICHTEDGYKMWVVQRHIFKPHAMEFHYPYGRPVTVKASNVIIEATEEPYWLQQHYYYGNATIGDGKTVVDP